MVEKDDSQVGGQSHMPSEELAELIVDALLRAGVIEQEHVSKAVKIAAEEIEVRKALGDY